jgi:hypothetical protein
MYLNQKALWAPVSQNALANPYGDIVNGESRTINVRRQEHVEEVRTSDGTIHRTNFIYYTQDNVEIDDRLDGYLVVDVYDMRSLGGKRRLRRLKTV